MAKKVLFVSRVSLNFVGGFSDSELNKVPEEAGLYVVFVCKKSGNDYDCERIAYIGKADKTKTSNLRERMRAHINNDFKNWKKECNMSVDETFIYCYAIYDGQYLEDVESALIYENQPIINVQSKDRYNGKCWYLSIESRGEKGLLEPIINVVRWISGTR